MYKFVSMCYMYSYGLQARNFGIKFHQSCLGLNCIFGASFVGVHMGNNVLVPHHYTASSMKARSLAACNGGKLNSPMCWLNVSSTR